MARTPKNQTLELRDDPAPETAATDTNQAAIGQPAEGEAFVTTAAPEPIAAEPEILIPSPLPTPGRIVWYAINEDETARAHNAKVGDFYPAIVVAVHEPHLVDLHVFMPGTGTHWAPHRAYGNTAGNWFWPPRA